MTAKEKILELYPKAQCCVELDSENARNKKYIVCRKIEDNIVEKMSIGEKSSNTANEAWENALIYFNNKKIIDNLHNKYANESMENALLKSENDFYAYEHKKQLNYLIVGLSFLLGAITFKYTRNLFI